MKRKAIDFGDTSDDDDDDDDDNNDSGQLTVSAWERQAAEIQRDSNRGIAERRHQQFPNSYRSPCSATKRTMPSTTTSAKTKQRTPVATERSPRTNTPRTETNEKMLSSSSSKTNHASTRKAVKVTRVRRRQAKRRRRPSRRTQESEEETTLEPPPMDESIAMEWDDDNEGESDNDRKPSAKNRCLPRSKELSSIAPATLPRAKGRSAFGRASRRRSHEDDDDDQASFVVPESQYLGLVEGIVTLDAGIQTSSNNVQQQQQQQQAQRLAYLSDVTLPGPAHATVADLLPTTGRATELCDVPLQAGVWTSRLVSPEGSSSVRDSQADWNGHVLVLSHADTTTFAPTTNATNDNRSRCDVYPSRPHHTWDIPARRAAPRRTQRSSTATASCSFVGVLALTVFDGFESQTELNQCSTSMADTVLAVTREKWQQSPSRRSATHPITKSNSHTLLTHLPAFDSIPRTRRQGKAVKGCGGVAVAVQLDDPATTTTTTNNGGYKIRITESVDPDLIVRVELLFSTTGQFKSRSAVASSSTTGSPVDGDTRTTPPFVVAPLTQTNLERHTIRVSSRQPVQLVGRVVVAGPSTMTTPPSTTKVASIGKRVHHRQTSPLQQGKSTVDDLMGVPKGVSWSPKLDDNDMLETQSSVDSNEDEERNDDTMAQNLFPEEPMDDTLLDSPEGTTTTTTKDTTLRFDTTTSVTPTPTATAVHKQKHSSIVTAVPDSSRATRTNLEQTLLFGMVESSSLSVGKARTVVNTPGSIPVVSCRPDSNTPLHHGLGEDTGAMQHSVPTAGVDNGINDIDQDKSFSEETIVDSDTFVGNDVFDDDDDDKHCLYHWSLSIVLFALTFPLLYWSFRWLLENYALDSDETMDRVALDAIHADWIDELPRPVVVAYEEGYIVHEFAD